MRNKGLGIIIIMLLLIAGFIYYFEATKTLVKEDKQVNLLSTGADNLPEWAKDDFTSMKAAIKAYEKSLPENSRLDDVTHTVGKPVISDGKALYPVVASYVALDSTNDNPVWTVNTYFIMQQGNRYNLVLSEPNYQPDTPNDGTYFYQDTDFGRFEYSITKKDASIYKDPDIEVSNEQTGRELRGMYPNKTEL